MNTFNKEQQELLNKCLFYLDACLCGMTSEQREHCICGYWRKPDGFYWSDHQAGD